MRDIEVQFYVQLTPDSTPDSGHHPLADLLEDVSAERDWGYVESPQNTGPAEAEEQLSLLAGFLALPCGDHPACSYDCEDYSCLGVIWMELLLQFLMSKVDDLHDCLVNGQGHQEIEALAAEVPRFLYACQPFFMHLDSTSTVSQHNRQPFDNYTRLLDRLEQLVYTFASYNLLCLDEAEPISLSHLCIGRRQLGPLRVSTYRYFKPTPYLAKVDTGVYKRMRWNVDRVQQADDQSEADLVGDTEYYFLCYEDIPNAHADAAGDNQSASCNVVRMWSIGQWEPVTPDTEDIYDWIMCVVPQANYHQLLYLGSDEPSICNATDYLQQLLSSHHTTE